MTPVLLVILLLPLEGLGLGLGLASLGRRLESSWAVADLEPRRNSRSPTACRSRRACVRHTCACDLDKARKPEGIASAWVYPSCCLSGNGERGCRYNMQIAVRSEPREMRESHPGPYYSTVTPIRGKAPPARLRMLRKLTKSRSL